MNDPIPKRRRWYRWLPLVAVGFALLVVVLAALWIYLPVLVSDRIPVDAIRRLGFDAFSGRVQAIGPTRTVAGPFVLGTKRRPALFIGSVTIDYTPGGLRRKKLRTIAIRDVVLNADLTPDGIVLPGLDLSSLTPVAPPRPEDGAIDAANVDSPLAGIKLEQLVLHGGQLNLSWEDVALHIPFSLVLTPTGADVRHFEGRLQVFIRDQPLSLKVTADLVRLSGRLQVDSPRLVLDAFDDLIGLFPGLSASGVVALKAKAFVELSPFSISDIQADVTWQGGRIQAGGVDLLAADASVARVSVVGETMDAITIQAGGFDLPLALPLALDALTAKMVRSDSGTRVLGSASLTVPAARPATALPAVLKSDVRLELAGEGIRGGDGSWQAKLTSTASTPNPPPIELNVDPGVSMTAGIPRLSMTASGQGRELNMNGSVVSDRVEIDIVNALGSAVVKGTMAGEARFKIAPDKDGLNYTGQATLNVPGLTLSGADVNGKLNAFALSLQGRKTKAGQPVLNGRLRCTNGRFAHRDSGVSLAGIELDCPFSLGGVPTDKTGRFRIRQISSGKRTLGEIDGRITWQPDAYGFNASVTSGMLPGLRADVDAQVQTAGDRIGQTVLTAVVPAWNIPGDIDLGAFAPAAAGVRLTGSMDGRGTLTLSRGRLSGNLDVALTDGDLELKEHRMALNGVNLALRFPELPRVRSAVAQRLRFDRAALGAIVVDGGSIDFQVESENTVFVEKGRMAWCGGVVDTGSLRVTAGKADYTVNLYCQRLGLSGILEQLGAVNAKGTGTVNGRIPITYKDGQLQFDDGFLFSTPGEGGRIQLTGTDILTRGIPAGTPQFTQVELAREALRDYTYDWAKLGLSSEGETFVLRLQFDGKPVHPLPFVYNQEIGGFMRVEAGGPGSNFQGIALDVNLRLPLNQLLQYKDLVNMIN